MLLNRFYILKYRPVFVQKNMFENLNYLVTVENIQSNAVKNNGLNADEQSKHNAK